MVNYVIERERDQALVFPFDGLKCTHCIGLSSSSLPIDKERRMISLEDIIQQWTASFSEHGLLRGRLIEDPIEVHLEYFIFEIERNSMVNQFQTSLSELVPKGTITDEDSDLAVAFFFVYVF